MAILLTAAALRLVGLDNVSPPGLAHDEVANWLIDRGILAGGHAIYFTRAYGHEAGFHYLQAGFVALLGDHALALRLPAAFLGLLLVAVTYALVRRLGGRAQALVAAALVAVLFWPVFYSRLALRAISLPVVSGLAAVLWWDAWRLAQRPPGAGELAGARPARAVAARFTLAGAVAGLSLHTYMAARAVPIFFGLLTALLFLGYRRQLRRAAVGMLFFWLALAVVASPLVVYLVSHPDAEARLAEVDAPLRALLAGDPAPVAANAWRILAGFGAGGDPLWRQNVAGRPVFDPALAALFYVGLLGLLWRWRNLRAGFVLLWLAASALPSLVTVDAPSSIRLINMLPVLAVPIAQVIHNITRLSTNITRLSTNGVYLWLSVWLMGHIWGTSTAIFHSWPADDEVRFVWQAALTGVAADLDDRPAVTRAAVAGWSPDTMDPPTMRLAGRRGDVRLSHFSPLDGTLLLPAGDGPVLTLYRPLILPLDADWERQLAAWGATQQATADFVRIELPARPPLPVDFSVDALLGGEMRLLGFSRPAAGVLVTAWEITAAPAGGRRLFVHALDEGGRLIGEDYRLDTADPQSLWQSHWRAGDRLLQRHQVPAETAAVRIGVFDPYRCQAGSCPNLPTADGQPYLLLPLPPLQDGASSDDAEFRLVADGALNAGGRVR